MTRKGCYSAMLGPSTAIRLRNMIVAHMSGGRAPLESGLGAKPPYAGVTIAILATETGATHLCHGQVGLASHAACPWCNVDALVITFGFGIYAPEPLATWRTDKHLDTNGKPNLAATVGFSCIEVVLRAAYEGAGGDESHPRIAASPSFVCSSS